MFQSHAGSIEARSYRDVMESILRRFNPTLVRLRPGFHPAPRGLRRAFQSHAGSIEAM